MARCRAGPILRISLRPIWPCGSIRWIMWAAEPAQPQPTCHRPLSQHTIRARPTPTVAAWWQARTSTSPTSWCRCCSPDSATPTTRRSYATTRRLAPRCSTLLPDQNLGLLLVAACGPHRHAVEVEDLLCGRLSETVERRHRLIDPRHRAPVALGRKRHDPACGVPRQSYRFCQNKQRLGVCLAHVALNDRRRHARHDGE